MKQLALCLVLLLSLTAPTASGHPSTPSVIRCVTFDLDGSRLNFPLEPPVPVPASNMDKLSLRVDISLLVARLQREAIQQPNPGPRLVDLARMAEAAATQDCVPGGLCVQPGPYGTSRITGCKSSCGGLGCCSLVVRSQQ